MNRAPEFNADSIKRMFDGDVHLFKQFDNYVHQLVAYFNRGNLLDKCDAEYCVQEAIYQVFSAFKQKKLPTQCNNVWICTAVRHTVFLYIRKVSKAYEYTSEKLSMELDGSELAFEVKCDKSERPICKFAFDNFLNVSIPSLREKVLHLYALDAVKKKKRVGSLLKHLRSIADARNTHHNHLSVSLRRSRQPCSIAC